MGRNIAKLQKTSEHQAVHLTCTITFTESIGNQEGNIRAFARCECGDHMAEPIELEREARDLVLDWFREAHPGLSFDSLDVEPRKRETTAAMPPTFSLPLPHRQEVLPHPSDDVSDDVELAVIVGEDEHDTDPPPSSAPPAPVKKTEKP